MLVSHYSQQRALQGEQSRRTLFIGRFFHCGVFLVPATTPSTQQRLPIDTKAFLICLVLCFIWGLQQVAIKAAGNDISPLLQVGIRSGVSGLFVFLLNHFYLHEKWAPVKWTDGFLVGITFAAEFFFVAEGLRYTSASHISVLLYTAPVFAAVGLAIRLPEERLSVVQWMGLLLAFVGIGVAFLLPVLLSDAPLTSGELWWVGDLLGLCAGLSWGSTTIFLRSTSMNDAVPTQMIAWQLWTAFVVLVPCAFLLDQVEFHSTLLGWSSLIFQSVIVSFLSYLAWSRLLRRYLAARLGVVVFLTPLFGVLLSILLLGESVGLPFIIGSLCVLVGMITVQTGGRLRKVFAWKKRF